MDKETQQQLDNLRQEIETIKNKDFVLPFQLDPQNDKVLEDKFSIHSALGRSHKTATQSINSGATDKIIWEVNDFYNEIIWDSTNNRFTIIRPGKYIVSSTIRFPSPSDNGLYGIVIYKNGAEYSRVDNGNAGTGIATPTITDILNLVKDDYIEIYGYHVSAGAENIAGDTKHCFFSIHKIN